jgi:hypothetical protein
MDALSIETVDDLHTHLDGRLMADCCRMRQTVVDPKRSV